MRAGACVPEQHSDRQPDLAAVLGSLFDYLGGHGIAFCVLRGADHTSPDRAGYELDVLVDREDFGRFADAAAREGFVTMPSSGHAPHAFFIKYDAAIRAWIKLDVVTDLLYGRPIRALSYGKPDGPLDRRVTWRGLPVLAPRDEMLHVLLHGLLDKPAFDGKYQARLEEVHRSIKLHAHDVNLLARDFVQAFGPALAWEDVAKACESRDWRDVVRRRASIVKAGLRRRRRHVLARVVQTGARRLLTRPLGSRLRRGMLVAIVGPDGAGKTTLAESIVTSAPFTVRRVYMGHGAGEVAREPGLLRALARWAQATAGPSKRSFVRGSTRWLARFALQCARSVEIRARRAAGHLVVLDRHVLDLLVPRRTTRLRRLLARLMTRICPQPDLVVVLDAPAEVLRRRKGDEHSIADLSAQRDAYVSFCRRLPHGIVISAARGQTEVRHEVVSHIWARYMRLEREVGR